MTPLVVFSERCALLFVRDTSRRSYRLEGDHETTASATITPSQSHSCTASIISQLLLRHPPKRGRSAHVDAQDADCQARNAIHRVERHQYWGSTVEQSVLLRTSTTSRSCGGSHALLQSILAQIQSKTCGTPRQRCIPHRNCSRNEHCLTAIAQTV